jgi:transposase
MRTQASIYSKRNPQLVKIFEGAGHPSKLMCVALDYAKAQHTALLCNGAGDLIKGAFAIDNNPQGVAELLKQVRAACKLKRIRPEHVFFGGEDSPSFAENFVRALREEKFLVVRVNAWEAKQQRDNFQASSDALDLLGIARCCLKRRAQSLFDPPAAYANLKIATRARDQLVRQRTRISNRIHTSVERLLPGFLDPDQSGVSPFGEASLALMEQGLSPGPLKGRPRAKLALWLGRRGVDKPLEVAAQLKHLATQVLGPAPEQTLVLQRSLGALVALYRCLEQNIGVLDREVAYWLARTPGALLTSIPGIGVTLAAGWTAELGAPTQWQALPRLCSYAGVVPRTKQTGGPGKEPVVGSVQARCNKRLKNVLLLAVEKVRAHGPEQLTRCAQELEARGAHTQFAMAKRLLRLGKCLVLSGTLYRPKALLDPDTPPATLAAYYQELWTKLPLKWKAKADLNEVFAPQHPLGQWRNMARELYALELRLPAQRAAHASSALTP